MGNNAFRIVRVACSSPRPRFIARACTCRAAVKACSPVHSRCPRRWSTVFARENDGDVELRRNLSMSPWDTTARARRETFAYDRLDCMHVQHPVGVLLHNAALQLGAGPLALDEYLESHCGAEEAAFKIWLDSVYGKWQRAQLNHFEHNIQVWMQLWHTIASSTVVCLVADVRNPIWHIPPSLVNEVVAVMKKPLIIVLSKCDLVPDANVRAWSHALRARFPAAAAVVPFSATGLLLGGVKSLAQRRRELKDVRVKKNAECLKRVADSVTRLLTAAGGDGASVAIAARRVMVVGGLGRGMGRREILVKVMTMMRRRRKKKRWRMTKKAKTKMWWWGGGGWKWQDALDGVMASMLRRQRAPAIPLLPLAHHPRLLARAT